MIHVTDIPPLEKPTSDDVATLLRARTKDLDGQEIGVFNANTRPTDTEVARIIDLAYAEVTGRCGLYIGSACAGSAKALVVIRAAAWVELSYFPEQVRSDRSVYAELADQWTTGLENVIACVEGDVPADGGEDSKAGYRFGVLDIHGWTASPYYGAPDVGAGDLITGAVGPAGEPGPMGPPGPEGPAGPTTVSETVEYAYSFNTNPPPGGGQLRFDADPYTGATRVYVSTASADGLDVTNYLKLVGTPSLIYVQDKDDAARWARFGVTAPATFYADRVEYPVVYQIGSVVVQLAAQRVLATFARTTN